MKTVLITGITGQDGYYLASLLLKKGYEVHGTIRRSSSINTNRIDSLISTFSTNGQLKLHYSDLLDSASLSYLINEIQPDEVYNLAAQSHVAVSFKNPVLTSQVGTLGSISLLEAIRSVDKNIKFYQASTSEMFGKVKEIPQTESTPFHPRSPYGCAKVYAYWATKNYREAYEMYACSGILFNHESPRRGETFVTRKVVQGLDKIAKGEQNVLTLGNLNAKRDWGHAKDYVEAMWLMLQQDKAEDYVIALDEQHSVREFIEEAAPHFGFDIEWFGEGEDEIGMDKKTKKTIVKVDSKYFRPSEVDTLLGDSTKARTELGWTPKISFKELVEDMCKNGK